MISKENVKSFEQKILEYLKNHPKGATITRMAEDIDASRNTIKKYVSVLMEKEQIYPRKVGSYTLYYIHGSEFDSEKVFKNFYMGLLYWLKQYVPEKEEMLKEIGREISRQFKMSLDMKKISNAIKEVRETGIPSLSIVQDILEDFRQYISLYQDSIIMAGINTLPLERKVTIRYSNVQLLVGTEEYVYHLYFLLGYIEGLFHGHDIPLKMDAGEIHSSENISTTYFDVVVDYSEILEPNKK